MKKFNILITFLLLLTMGMDAKHVDEVTAQKVGKAFLATQTNSKSFGSTIELSLAYKSVSNKYNALASAEPETYFYVFNANNIGFVMVAADDNVTPVLGYSDEGAFDGENIPKSVAKWMEEYKQQIRFVIENKTNATDAIRMQWNSYLSGYASATLGGYRSVSPLVQTKWNQSPYYNALCPYDNSYNQRTVSGCVATAVTQVMKYWNYPDKGSGSHSYSHSKYGTLSANFGATTYNWSAMPAVVTSANTAVATLTYHVGVSVEMNYGVGATGGSGAYVISSKSAATHCAEYALETYFGYKSSLQGIERVNYSESNWLSTIKTEIDAARPVIYAGFGSGGGHCFIADGYDNNDFIHFNWGWGGNSDGYFNINALNPAALGTGGGSGGFNSGHQAIIGVEPPSAGTEVELKLNSFVTVNPSTIYYGQAFTVSANFVNSGTNPFSGDYCAAVFDSESNFIDYVQILSGYSLNAGYTYTNSLDFQSSGSLSFLPGNYTIGIFYRKTGGNWVLAEDNNSFTNMVPFTVINPSDIELNAPLALTPGTTVVQGQTLSVNTNFVNNGSNTFYGTYSLAIYNLDGSFAQSIGSLNETNGLPVGYTYQAPYLTFTSSAITLEPGTYLVAALYNYNSTGWKVAGSSSYQNPIKITIKSPSLSPDPYEVNNSFAQAFNLSFTFSANAANVLTPSSNIHEGTDHDYYKVVLPKGYDYTLNARIHDAYNSGNGVEYTVDALVSYSLDGVTWSDTYDDIIGFDIEVNNGGTVFFKVAPYFAGETGTYLLDFDMERTGNAVFVSPEPAASAISVYPNPATTQLFVDWSDIHTDVSSISLVSITGTVVETAVVAAGTTSYMFATENLAEGIYFVNVVSTDGILTQKVVIRK